MEIETEESEIEGAKKVLETNKEKNLMILPKELEDSKLVAIINMTEADKPDIEVTEKVTKIEEEKNLKILPEGPKDRP